MSTIYMYMSDRHHRQAVCVIVFAEGVEQQLLLPQYGLSRLLQRLEVAEYIMRWRCEQDGRGQVVSITDKGRDVRKQMWPVYAAVLQDLFGEKLDDQQAEQLAERLGQLLQK